LSRVVGEVPAVEVHGGTAGIVDLDPVGESRFSSVSPRVFDAMNSLM
jgi:hypothetical protein